MSTQVLRPNATVADEGWGGSGGAHHTNLADDTDATWAHSGNTTTPSLVLGFTDLSALGSGAQVVSVTPRLRVRSGAASGTLYMFAQLIVDGALSATQRFGTQVTLSWETLTGSAMPVSPMTGLPWTEAEANSVQLGLDASFPQGAHFQIAEAYLDVVINTTPTVNVTAPTSTQVDKPCLTVTWDFTDPDLDAQEGFRVRVFSGTGAVADPDTETARLVHDSGDVYGSQKTHAVGISLGNTGEGTGYTVAAKARDIGTHNYGPWDQQAVTFTHALPSGGTAVAAPSPSTASVALTLTETPADNAPAVEQWGVEYAVFAVNLLTDNESSGETDASGWTAFGNTTTPTSGTPAAHGTKAVQTTVTNATSGAIRVLRSVPVSPARRYGACFSWRGVTVARQARVRLDWYDVISTYLSTTLGSFSPGSTSAYLVATAFDATPPADAALVQLIVDFGAGSSSDVQLVDVAAIGELADWVTSRNGPIAVANLLAENQSQFEVAGSVGWVDDNASDAGTPLRSTAASLEGAAAMLARSGGLPIGDLRVRLSPRVAVAGSTVYHLSSNSKPNTTGRNHQALIRYYNAASGGSLLATNSGGAQAEVAGRFVPAGVSGAAAPSGATHAEAVLVWVTPGATETHYVDDLRLQVLAFTGTLYDIPRKGVVLLRVTPQRTVQSGCVQKGTASVSSVVLDVDRYARLRPAADLSAGLAVLHVDDDWQTESPEDLELAEAAGNRYPIPYSGTIRAERGKATFLLPNDADYREFERVRALGGAVLFQTTWGDETAEQYWVRLGAVRSTTRVNLPGEPTQWRSVTIDLHEVAAP